MPEPTPLDLLRAVLDPDRLAVLGHAAGGDRDFTNLRETHEGKPRAIAEAIGELHADGFLTPEGFVDRGVFRSIAQQLPAREPGLGQPVDGPWTPTEAEVLGRFYADGRLVQIPSVSSKRTLVYEKIVQEFEPGRRYSERDVNFMIQLVYADYATVRRGLVDEAFMDRADGVYWRVGGRYEQPTDPGDTSLDDWTLRTDRSDVVLRPYNSSMVDVLVEAANDPRIARYMRDRFPSPYTRNDAEEWLDIATGVSQPTQFAIYADGSFVGGLGGDLGTGERTGSAEIGWWINPQYWGRGIMTAAARTLIDYLFEKLGIMRLWAPVMTPNIGSARVAEKAGMYLEGTAPAAYLKNGDRMDQLNFGLTREQWSGARLRDGAAYP